MSENYIFKLKFFHFQNKALQHEISDRELELEYIRYLTMACADVSSSAVYESQINDIQNQVMFLNQIVSDKKNSLEEIRRKDVLLSQYEAVSNAHISQKELLEDFNEIIPVNEDHTKVLLETLEKRLHQIKIENIYQPENDNEHRNELIYALEELSSSVGEFYDILSPQSENLNVLNSLISSLKDSFCTLTKKETISNQIDSLAVQEASLSITANKLES